jgi:predicted nucleic acid-binding protein
MIAATASAHGVPLVTANAEDLRGAEALMKIVGVSSA